MSHTDSEERWWVILTILGNFKRRFFSCEFRVLRSALSEFHEGFFGFLDSLFLELHGRMVVSALDFFKTNGKIQIYDQFYSLRIGDCDASKKSDVFIDLTRQQSHFLWFISEMSRLVLKSQWNAHERHLVDGFPPTKYVFWLIEPSAFRFFRFEPRLVTGPTGKKRLKNINYSNSLVNYYKTPTCGHILISKILIFMLSTTLNHKYWLIK